ncbi:MAG: chemotaxis protein CheD [Spirochaetales bacterium]|uniref:Probable chemoreceptor glutamine deamidase CheD n=1 Tax=Candidatus Thalassospirochaeta sargassi TaxID=3119039 RepID=A0AAJ1IDL5_9SPIO|nr:chemotaxis protein CheD [Spirochaetales bacterium]
MYKYYDNTLKKESVNLAPGEFFVSSEDIIINTILGSCVAVALYDPELKAAGLNHFMLAESKTPHTAGSVFNIERYGLYAMDALINGFIKRGSRRSRLQAKIFGGSSVLESSGGKMNIGADNIAFAEEYLSAENIPVINHDTGGDRARRIYLFPQSFRVLLRRIQPGSQLRRQMDSYRTRLEQIKGRGGDSILF